MDIMDTGHMDTDTHALRVSMSMGVRQPVPSAAKPTAVQIVSAVLEAV